MHAEARRNGRGNGVTRCTEVLRNRRKMAVFARRGAEEWEREWCDEVH